MKKLFFTFFIFQRLTSKSSPSHMSSLRKMAYPNCVLFWLNYKERFGHIVTVLRHSLPVVKSDGMVSNMLNVIVP